MLNWITLDESETDHIFELMNYSTPFSKIHSLSEGLNYNNLVICSPSFILVGKGRVQKIVFFQGVTQKM